MPLYRVAWDALNFHRHSELHQSSASAGSMKTVYVSLSIVVIWRRASKVVRPNPSLKRNTKSGPSYSASLLNFRPARFWYPLSSNVRPHNQIVAHSYDWSQQVLIRLAVSILLPAIIAGCGSIETERRYTDVPGRKVQELAASVLRKNGYSTEERVYRDYTIYAKSEMIEVPATFVLASYQTWTELEVTAREHSDTPILVDLLVGVKVWRQPKVGSKELVKSELERKRIEADRALRELDELVREFKIRK